jgi:predicted RNase H-like HicB family nuclease
MAHYYVVAERGDGRTWWLSFPHGPGIYSAADDAADIPAQARDALESVLMHPPADLPRSIEDGAMPPTAAALAEFEQPTIVVVVSFEPATMAKAAE